MKSKSILIIARNSMEDGQINIRFPSLSAVQINTKWKFANSPSFCHQIIWIYFTKLTWNMNTAHPSSLMDGLFLNKQKLSF